MAQFRQNKNVLDAAVRQEPKQYVMCRSERTIPNDSDIGQDDRHNNDDNHHVGSNPT